MTTPDVVILAPGFFGFDRFGTFSYFGDRVSAAIRGHVESRLKTSVPVVPVTLGPADSLAHRQRSLLEVTNKIVAELGGVERVHFVGHSTGGLDAESLLRKYRFDRQPWTREEEDLRGRIASVVTIAAPHYGTTLSLTDISRWLARPAARLPLIGAVVPAAVASVEALPEHALSLSQLLGGGTALLAFLGRFVERRELLVDLEPERVERERAENPRVIPAPVSCFVTCPLPNPDPVLEAAVDSPDSLFLYLTNHTAGARVREVSADVQNNISRLNGPDVPRIRSASRVGPVPHTFDETDNDAVVNSARQLLPSAELAAIVHADHADVLGHYDRRDPVYQNRIINEGVFRSGARFGDDEFFHLYREVGARIADAAERAAMTLPNAVGGRTAPRVAEATNEPTA